MKRLAAAISILLSVCARPAGADVTVDTTADLDVDDAACSLLTTITTVTTTSITSTTTSVPPTTTSTTLGTTSSTTLVTTSTTVAPTSTTTSTLPFGCAGIPEGPTFPSIRCRLDGKPDDRQDAP